MHLAADGGIHRDHRQRLRFAPADIGIDVIPQQQRRVDHEPLVFPAGDMLARRQRPVVHRVDAQQRAARRRHAALVHHRVAEAGLAVEIPVRDEHDLATVLHPNLPVLGRADGGDFQRTGADAGIGIDIEVIAQQQPRCDAQHLVLARIDDPLGYDRRRVVRRMQGDPDACDRAGALAVLHDVVQRVDDAILVGRRRVVNLPVGQQFGPPERDARDAGHFQSVAVDVTVIRQQGERIDQQRHVLGRRDRLAGDTRRIVQRLQPDSHQMLIQLATPVGQHAGKAGLACMVGLRPEADPCRRIVATDGPMAGTMQANQPQAGRRIFGRERAQRGMFEGLVVERQPGVFPRLDIDDTQMRDAALRDRGWRRRAVGRAGARRFADDDGQAYVQPADLLALACRQQAVHVRVRRLLLGRGFRICRRDCFIALDICGADPSAGHPAIIEGIAGSQRLRAQGLADTKQLRFAGGIGSGIAQLAEGDPHLLQRSRTAGSTQTSSSPK